MLEVQTYSEQIMPEEEEVSTSDLQFGQCPTASGMLKFS